VHACRHTVTIVNTVNYFSNVLNFQEVDYRVIASERNVAKVILKNI
jgi:hypothetical protein